MRIEQFHDEHGIYFRASEEAFLLSKEQAASIRKYIDELRELVRDMRKAFIHGPCYRWCEHMPEPCNGDICQYVRRMKELGV